MGLREEQLVSSTPLKGLDFEDESPPFYSNGGWTSDPLDCPPYEGCNPESMVGTMSLRKGSPSRAGRKSDL